MDIQQTLNIIADDIKCIREQVEEIEKRIYTLEEMADGYIQDDLK